MIVYYRDSDKFILCVRGDRGKNHLDDTALQAECDTMFPMETPGDVKVQRFPENKTASPAGTWNPATKVMTSPPVSPQKPPHPEKDRIKELRDGWRDTPGVANPAEIAEALVKSGLLDTIADS